MASERWLTVNNLRVRVLEGGSGSLNLVFVHGLSFSADTWRQCCLSRFENRYKVYAIDMPYGPRSMSDHFERRHEDDYARHLRAVLEALNVGKPILIGASIGGETVLRYLALGYDALGAVVIGPVGVGRIRLSNIRVPVLGIWGSEDDVSPRYNADLLARAGFKVVFIEGARHAAYLDKPEEFVNIVEEFIRQLASS